MKNGFVTIKGFVTRSYSDWKWKMNYETEEEFQSALIDDIACGDLVHHAGEVVDENLVNGRKIITILVSGEMYFGMSDLQKIKEIIENEYDFGELDNITVE